MTTLELHDDEFGPIVVRCNPAARRVILRVKGDASVHITVPHRRHLPDAKRLLDETRHTVRRQRRELQDRAPVYAPGVMVGRSHQLVFRVHSGEDVTTRVGADQIMVKYPFHLTPDHPEVQRKVRLAAKKALRRQADTFLPARLAELSRHWGIAYRGVRIMSGHSRWGSCSSDNVISLNFSLMEVPERLIDYVICHELCHTIEHNHSERFWAQVAIRLPHWKELRKELKALHSA